MDLPLSISESFHFWIKLYADRKYDKLQTKMVTTHGYTLKLQDSVNSQGCSIWPPKIILHPFKHNNILRSPSQLFFLTWKSPWISRYGTIFILLELLTCHIASYTLLVCSRSTHCLSMSYHHLERGVSKRTQTEISTSFLQSRLWKPLRLITAL